jgi:nicotinamide-nucleotide adenylyltransferase
VTSARVRGVLIGRFQPFHRGHLAVVREIRSLRPDDGLVLAVGSAQASYSWTNPFTAGERAEMIGAALDEAEVRGVTVVPIVDLDRHALWVAHVESLLPKFERVYTNNPLTRALFERAGYTVESPTLVERERFEGARIRAALAADRGWQEFVPPAVARSLLRLHAAERLAMLRPATDPTPGPDRP